MKARKGRTTFKKVTSLSQKQVNGYVFDTGALIALEKGGPLIRRLMNVIHEDGSPVVIPAGVLAQVWRNHSRQYPIHRLLRFSYVTVVPLDLTMALDLGALCADSGHTDVVDASVALCARRYRYLIVTSDPDDIRALDPDVAVQAL
jgi:hypothetical protein